MDKHEYTKNYYQLNKDKIKAHNLEAYNNNKDKRKEQMACYWINNREVILQKKNEPLVCLCGGHYTRCNKSKHFSSKKHQVYINISDNINDI